MSLEINHIEQLLKELQAKGASNIHSVSHRWYEDRRQEDEFTDDELIWEQDGRYYQGKRHQHDICRFWKSEKPKIAWDDPIEISKTEFDEHSQYLQRLDSPETQHAIDVKRREDEESQRKLNAQTPRCSQCGSIMVRRKGIHGSFFGCSKFGVTGCKGTRN